MLKIEDYKANLDRIETEIEQNRKAKAGLKEKALDQLEDIEDLKKEGAERKDIRSAKKILESTHKQIDALSSKYYWLRSQKKTCCESIMYLTKQGNK